MTALAHVAADRRLHHALLGGAMLLAAMPLVTLSVQRMTMADGLPIPICMAQNTGHAQEVVPLGSYALPNVPGKRVTIVRVRYGPGGFTAAHRHAGSVTATIIKGVIRSQLDGGPTQDFTVGETFFEPPGAIHRVSANASATEDAELMAVFVADEGAQLTTFLD